MTQPQDKYVLRLPEGLRDKIKKISALNHRSMNAELVHMIETRVECELGRHNQIKASEALRSAGFGKNYANEINQGARHD